MFASRPEPARRRWLRRCTTLFAAAATLAGCATSAPPASGLQRLYVLDCGINQAKDQSRWSPGVNAGKPIEFSDNCYLIRHAKGLLLWDTGIPDAVASMPAGLTYDWAMARENKPAFAADQKFRKLSGDHDVFGDGSVRILSTPGHTPGHQALLVRLPKTGAIVLSGDAVHFQDNWENRRVPSMNVDRDQSLASMQRIADVLAAEKAQLWINHDKPQSARLRYAPRHYE